MLAVPGVPGDAGQLGGDARGVTTLLNALTALGLLKKDGDRFSNTPATSAQALPPAPLAVSGARRASTTVSSSINSRISPLERPAARIGWEQAAEFYRALQETRRPHIFVWGQSGHGQRARLPISLNDRHMPMDLRIDQSLPAFTNCSLDDDPGNPIMIISHSFGGDRYFSACDASLPALTTAAASAVSAGIL